MRRQLKDLVLDDQRLSELAIAARSNAADLVEDSVVLLDAGRYGRAHALAVLALEELGKVTLCLEGIFGSLSNQQVLEVWDSHAEKLMRGHQLALLWVDHYSSKDVIDRLNEAVRADAAVRLQGFYVDPTPSGISVPVAVSQGAAIDLIELLRDVLDVVIEFDLVGAPAAYRTPDAMKARHVMSEVGRVLADSASGADKLPPNERQAAESRLAAAIDDFVGEFRATQLGSK